MLQDSLRNEPKKLNMFNSLLGFPWEISASKSSCISFTSSCAENVSCSWNVIGSFLVKDEASCDKELSGGDMASRRIMFRSCLFTLENHTGWYWYSMVWQENTFWHLLFVTVIPLGTSCYTLSKRTKSLSAVRIEKENGCKPHREPSGGAQVW